MVVILAGSNFGNFTNLCQIREIKDRRNIIQDTTDEN